MQLLKKRRQRRVRTKGKLVSNRARLSVHKSLKYISVQIIDDTKGITLAATTEKKYAGEKPEARLSKMAAELATKAKEAKVKDVWFDRGERTYHGRIATFADLLRKEGLNF